MYVGIRKDMSMLEIYQKCMDKYIDQQLIKHIRTCKKNYEVGLMP